MKIKKRKGTAWLVMLIIVIFASAAFYAFHSAKIKSREAAMLKNKVDISSIYELPDTYTSKIRERGKLVELSYDVKLTDGTRRTVRKSAMVYVPYGYSDSKKYDVFYLMHGYGGSQYTFLGTEMSPRAFKYILDNMIANGDIPPTIVAAPTYTDEIADYYTKLDALSHEVTHELMGAVETKYSTYAEDATEESYRASRAHRAFGGFSMGGCETWRLLRDHADLAKYYLPVSMPMYYVDYGYDMSMSRRCASEIADGVEASGAKKGSCFVFAASGTADFMCRATEMQARDLAAISNRFEYADDGSSGGSITFHAWKGITHHYYNTYPYLYNGLIRFFK